MIDNTGKMMRVLDDAKQTWFIPSSPVTQYRAVVSNNPQSIKQDSRTTSKRPLKRQVKKKKYYDFINFIDF